MRPEDALRCALDAGIHCLRIPTPFAVGRVNCYLIEDDPLTLIDTGPNSGKALDELQHQLGDHGYSIDDLELIVVSHQHIDHLGLVEIIVEHSGAEVAAIDVAVHRLGAFAEESELEDRFAADLMIRHGLPQNLVQALRSVSASYRGWGSSAKVTRPLRDGQTLELRDRKLEVFHRPGHSPSDTIFWQEDQRILLAADHLIKHISSNPLISRPLDGSTKRTQALVTYIDSLKKTREMPAEVVFSGHGDPITDHVTLIDQRFASTERRKRKIHRLISDRPQTGYDLARELWGNVAVTQAYLCISEVLGHVDILINDGLIREVPEGEQVIFEALDPPPGK